MKFTEGVSVTFAEDASVKFADPVSINFAEGVTMVSLDKICCQQDFLLAMFAVIYCG